jgi:anti-sigma factor RsiW
MKPCRKNRKQIAWLVMDALDSSEAAVLNRHLQQCEGCRGYRLELSRVKQRFSSPELLTMAEVPLRELPFRKVRSRTLTRKLAGGTPALPGLNWRLGLPALGAIIVGILAFSALVRRPVPPPDRLDQANSVAAPSPSAALLPTLGNYRAVANQSLDELDDLLARQSKRPIPAPPSFSVVSLAVLKVGE